VALIEGYALKVCRSLQCGMRHIPYRTTWFQSGGQFFPWPRCYRLEAVTNNRRHSSRKSRGKAVWLSQQQDFGGHCARIGYNKPTKRHGNGETSGGMGIAQNGQGPRLFGPVAGQPTPTYNSEGILLSKQADDRHGMHF
jgi:hypothetical protein